MIRKYLLKPNALRWFCGFTNYCGLIGSAYFQAVGKAKKHFTNF
jgi:hypothetical protein